MRIAPRCGFIAVLLGALVLTACDGGGEDESPEQTALNNALTSWAGVVATHYQYVSQRSCECLPEVGMPIIVEVMDGAIVNAVYETDLAPVSPEVEGTLNTVQSLFDLIQDAIDNGAYSIDVSYDGDTGVPRSINIDYDVNIADEEFYLDIRDFEIIASVGF